MKSRSEIAEMSSSKLLRAAGPVAVLIGLLAFITVADASVTCKVDPDTNRYVCRATVTKVPGAAQIITEQLPLKWSRKEVGGIVPGSINGTCTRQIAPPPGLPAPPPGVDPGVYTEIGTWWFVEVINTATGTTVATDSFCQYPGQEAPEPPPPPPSYELIVENMQEALKLPPRVNPGGGVPGLTGLDSWLWCDDPGSVGPSVELNGWRGEVAASVSHLDWSMKGPSPAERSARECGSEAQPAAIWIPETMGPHSVTLTATYSGTWTLSGQVDLGGGPVPVAPQTFPLADVVVPSDPLDYPVIEHVGVLVG